MRYWINYLEPHLTKNIDAMLFVPVGCCLRDRAEVCRALFFLGQYFLGRIFAPVAVPRNDNYFVSMSHYQSGCSTSIQRKHIYEAAKSDQLILY